MTIEPEGDGEGEGKQTANPVFFDGKKLRPEAAAYRLAVKKDSTLGHVRELERDLSHLERTIAERAAAGRDARGAAPVDEKVHDLVDEAGSLAADPAFEEQRRALTGRALALAAALDWPGAAAAGDGGARRRPPPHAARAPTRPSRARASTCSRARTTRPPSSPRARRRSRASRRASTTSSGARCSAAGKQAAGLAALKRYLDDDPADPQGAQAGGDRRPRAGARARRPPPTASCASRPRPSAVSLHSKTLRLRRSTGRSPGASSRSRRRPGPGSSSSSRPAACCATTARPNARGASLLVQRPGPGRGGRRSPARAPATCSPTRSSSRSRRCSPAAGASSSASASRARQRQGEVTTVERNGVVFFLVLNASTASYPKLKDEYAAFVKSLKKPEP